MGKAVFHELLHRVILSYDTKAATIPKKTSRMPTTLSLQLAHDIKNTVWDADDDDDDHMTINAASWFRPPDTWRGVTMKHISYSAISKLADQEYSKWRSVHKDIDYRNNSLDNLKAWVEDIDIPSLAAIIETTPIGVAVHKEHDTNPFTENAVGVDDDVQLQAYAFKFTAWQRLSMAHWSNMPFDTTSSVYIEIKKLTYASTNRMPIQAQYTMLKGSFPDYGIIDLPTAAGKTAWSCSVAFMAVKSDRITSLMEEYRMKKLGTMLQGLPQMCVARMVLIATAASTYDHYFSTVNDLIPEFKRLDPASKVVFWYGTRREYSIKAASERHASTIIFWIVPVKQLNTIMRATPTIAVAVCITDEFTIDTPKERLRTAKSTVLKQIITQATPQALVEATRGNSTWLKQLFLGTLIPPHDIYNYVIKHEFKKAHEGCEHLCMLDLATLTAYRSVIRNELRSLVPSGLDLFFVFSRRMTLSAYLMKSSTELVPLKLAHVLLQWIQRSGLKPSPQAIQEFTTSMNEVERASAIVDVLHELLSTLDRDVVANSLDLKRLMQRINEFIVACPICTLENQSTLRAFGCCGYCVCDTCFQHCKTRCPFCRTPVVLVPKSLEDAVKDAEAAEALALKNEIDYPTLSESVTNAGTDFASRLSHFVAEGHKQSYNLTMCLHVLKEHALKRILILIERDDSQEYAFLFDSIVNVKILSEVTNIKIHRIDNILTGSGKHFTTIKREFDTTSNGPIALVSYGMGPELLVGTNFDYVDAMIILGKLPFQHLTQALARTFRPRATRDNSKPIVMIRMHQ